MIEAKIIADSWYKPFEDIPWTPTRLTTIEVTFNRFILAEVNTHRVFSRNSASSRAIPIEKQIAKIRNLPAFPLRFGTNQSGMQAGPPLTGEAELKAYELWSEAALEAADRAEQFLELGVHKEVVNRILEPYMWHTAIISATDWHGFFRQRISPLAQPEINRLAELMLEAYNASTPKTTVYHLPYLSSEEESELSLDTQKKVSVARCARVSYLTHDGKRDIEKDLQLYDRLVTANPPHYSPLEHVAKTCKHNIQQLGEDLYLPKVGNFTGWLQVRHEDKEIYL